MAALLPDLHYTNFASPNYGVRREEQAPTMLVMHYTACPTDEALKTLTSKTKEVSAHYLIPPDGEPIYCLVNEKDRAWHAGASYWRGVEDVNSASIGIENVNWGYTYGWVPPEPKNIFVRYAWSSLVHMQRKIGDYGVEKQLPLKKQWHPFALNQIETLARLSQNIIGKYGIEPENVVGHSDVAPQRKVDPGPLFPWKNLAEKGIGVWHSPLTDRVHSDKPEAISIPWMQKSLQDWGYKLPQNGNLDTETQKVIAAFQMHFRPQNYQGIPDVESMEILDHLLCQRRNKEDPH